jgi:hypothetical protein
VLAAAEAELTASSKVRYTSYMRLVPRRVVQTRLCKARVSVCSDVAARFGPIANPAMTVWRGTRLILCALACRSTKPRTRRTRRPSRSLRPS